MRKIKLIVIICILLGSCSKYDRNKSPEQHTYLKGKIIERFGDTVVLIDAQVIDSITNHVYSQGQFFHDQKNGKFYESDWHTFFDKNGNVKEKIEYYLRSFDDQILVLISQKIVFNEYGDTVKEKSSYFETFPNFKDTLRKNDTLRLKFKLYHEENKDEIVGNYKMMIKNSFNDRIDSIYFNKPIIEYKFVAKDTGVMHIDAQILFYLPTEHLDSLLPIKMFYEKKFIVDN